MNRANEFAKRLDLDVEKARILGEMLGQAFVRGIEVGYDLEDKPELTEEQWLVYVRGLAPVELYKWLSGDPAEPV